MNLRQFNDSFKKVYEPYLYECSNSTNVELKDALNRVLYSSIITEQYDYNNTARLIESTIENMYPNTSWWEVVDCDITNTLVNSSSLKEAVDTICDSIKKEFVEDFSVVDELKNNGFSILSIDDVRNQNVDGVDDDLIKNMEFVGASVLLHNDIMARNWLFTDIDSMISYFENGGQVGYENAEQLVEDTVQKANGKWTNRGDDGEEHGEFDTKKEADAQRKAMYANGFKG